MDNKINRVSQFNTSYSIGAAGEKQEGKAQQKKEEEKNPSVDRQQVSREDTLKFMNATSVNVRPVEKQRVLNVSKYVDAESMKRIENSTAQFENTINNVVNLISNEIGFSINDEAKLNLAIAMINADLGSPYIEESPTAENTVATEKAIGDMLNYLRPMVESYFVD